MKGTAAAGAQGQPDAEFPRPRADRRGDHAVDAHGSDRKSDAGKKRKQQRKESGPGLRPRKNIFHQSHIRHRQRGIDFAKLLTHDAGQRRKRFIAWHDGGDEPKDPLLEDLIEAEGESGPFLTFTRQPAHRGEGRDQQLHRFMGTRSGRKIRYGHLLAAALDLTGIPAPLASLLSAV